MQLDVIDLISLLENHDLRNSEEYLLDYYELSLFHLDTSIKIGELSQWFYLRKRVHVNQTKQTFEV